MVRIPYIKIPSVRVRCIDPASNIGTGGATPAPPTPITYLTQWKIVGNSEVHGTEIWSCGEYNATDGKYHVLVSPLGGSIADIALDEPLRKVGDVVDTIEFPSGTEGKALVTRNLKSVDLGTLEYTKRDDIGEAIFMSRLLDRKYVPECVGLIADTTQKSPISAGPQSKNLRDKEWCYYYLSTNASFTFYIRLVQYKNYTAEEFASAMIGKEFIYELATPTTELVDAPQIEEAESYTCVISQGAKAVSWSSFETNRE